MSEIENETEPAIDLVRRITEAQLIFQRKLLNAPPEVKPITAQTQIAHDLIAIRLILQSALQSTR